MDVVHVNNLMVGDTFLGWCPQWRHNVVEELCVVAMRETCIKVKTNSCCWWMKKDIIVYEVLNRRVKKDAEKGSVKGIKRARRIDINSLDVGNKVLWQRPWTKYVWEGVVAGAKGSVIKLRGVGCGWQEKETTIIRDVLMEEAPDEEWVGEICPFMSTLHDIVVCTKRCRLRRDNLCVMERMVVVLDGIESNTDDE